MSKISHSFLSDEEKISVYLKAFPLDDDPTTEKLVAACRALKSEDKAVSDEGMTQLLGCATSVILSIIHRDFKMFIDDHLAEMIEEGYMAVCASADKYDPLKESFRDFFEPRIQWRIRQYTKMFH